MSKHLQTLPRERLDAVIGWQLIAPPDAAGGLLPEEDVLHLAAASLGEDGAPVFAQPIPEADPWGSFGGKSLPRGAATSPVGDVYLCDPIGGRILYTRATMPPAPQPDVAPAPFVPLWHFPSDPGVHPLALQNPVGLTLVPANAAVGAFGDCLVVADAGRSLLVWVDRRQIITRHTLALDHAPIAVASDAQGRIAVLVDEGGASKVLIIEAGRLVAQSSLGVVASAIAAFGAGSWLIAAAGQVLAVNASAQLLDPALVATKPAVAPAFEIENGRLALPGECASQESLPFADIALDRAGNLQGTSLRLVTRPARLPRPRIGTLICGPFDGEAQGFAWDRITFEGDLPAQCRLTLSTFVSDAPLDEVQIDTLAVWTGDVDFKTGTPQTCLVQANRGRYLWMRITATGDGSATPAVHGIDLFGPRSSQMALLPAPFHQDPQSADFLDRFLSLQDGAYDVALGNFAQVSRILRPHAAPEGFLDWLGSWFDWRFLAQWNDATRREMIAASMGFFRQRGTIGGLTQMLRWHTGLSGALPLVLEDYRIAAQGGGLSLGGEPLTIPANGGAHCFTVVLPRFAAKTAQDEAAIKRIIEAQKPAHTLYRLVLIDPAFQPTTQATLGVDTILPDGRPPPLGAGTLDGQLQTVATC